MIGHCHLLDPALDNSSFSSAVVCGWHLWRLLRTKHWWIDLLPKGRVRLAEDVKICHFGVHCIPRIETSVRSVEEHALEFENKVDCVHGRS